jgi:TPR repeat protein
MGRLGWRYVERRKGVFAPDAGRPNQGTGVTQNNKEAVRWLQAGARAGDRRAMANLGFFYTEGLGGLPKDDVEAVKWFRRGADAGDRRAMASLGLMYVLGRGGLKQDDTSAVRLFRAAAVDEDPMVVEGDAQAMLHLGLHYLMGRGVAQNDAEAVRWMTRAMQRNSVHGYPMAALNLGVLYATGAAGVPKNLGQASVLFGAGNATYADALGAPELFELGNGTSDQMYATLARYRQAADNQRNPQSLSGGQLLLLAGAFVVIVAALSNGGRALPPSTTSDLLTHERNPMCDFPMTFDEAGVFGLFGAGC